MAPAFPGCRPFSRSDRVAYSDQPIGCRKHELPYSCAPFRNEHDNGLEPIIPVWKTGVLPITPIVHVIAGKPQECKPGNLLLRVGSHVGCRSPTPTLGASLCAFRLAMSSSAPDTRFHVFRLSGMPYESGWLQLCSWWDEMELNHPSRMTADLQSAPLPLTVYHPMWCKQIRIEAGPFILLHYHCATPRCRGARNRTWDTKFLRSIRPLQYCLREHPNTEREQ